MLRIVVVLLSCVLACHGWFPEGDFLDRFANLVATPLRELVENVNNNGPYNKSIFVKGEYLIDFALNNTAHLLEEMEDYLAVRQSGGNNSLSSNNNNNNETDELRQVYESTVDMLVVFQKLRLTNTNSVSLWRERYERFNCSQYRHRRSAMSLEDDERKAAANADPDPHQQPIADLASVTSTNVKSDKGDHIIIITKPKAITTTVWPPPTKENDNQTEADRSTKPVEPDDSATPKPSPVIARPSIHDRVVMRKFTAVNDHENSTPAPDTDQTYIQAINLLHIIKAERVKQRTIYSRRIDNLECIDLEKVIHRALIENRYFANLIDTSRETLLDVMKQERNLSVRFFSHNRADSPEYHVDDDEREALTNRIVKVKSFLYWLQQAKTHFMNKKSYDRHTNLISKLLKSFDVLTSSDSDQLRPFNELLNKLYAGIDVYRLRLNNLNGHKFDDL